MIVPILKSLGITFIVSGSLAYFLTHFNISFWKTFILATVIQVVVWNIVNYSTQIRAALRNKELDEKILADFAKQIVTVPCAYCKVPNAVPVRLDTNNQFDCIDCYKTNTVYIDVESAQVTVPITDATPIETTIRVNENR